MNTGFLQQQSMLGSAAVRSAPSPQHGAHTLNAGLAPAQRSEDERDIRAPRPKQSHRP
jgi:hypothetical protein